MKKLILIIIAVSFMFSFSVNSELNSELNNDVTYKSELAKCKYRQCNAIAKSTNKRCKRCVSKAKAYQCFQHKPK